MTKKVSLIAILLLTIGVIGSIITFSSKYSSSEASDETKQIQNENITSIEIDVKNADVEIIPVQHGEAKIELISENGETLRDDFTIKEENDTLSIVQQSSKNKWFNFSLNMKTLTLKIYVPEQMYNNISIDGISSDLFLQNVEVKSIDLSTTSGDIEGEDIQSENVALKTTSGDVHIENVQGEIQTKTDSGDIALSMSEITKNITLKTSSGDIIISSTKEPSDVTFDVDTSSGDVDLFHKYNGNAKIGEGTILIQLKTSSGDIAVIDY